MDRLLAGRKKGVGVDMHDGPGPGRDGEGLSGHGTSKNFYAKA
jgi:hypothetical protein